MTCKDCLGDVFCSKQDKKKRVDKYCADADEVCKYFKDKNRFIELPCKIGDLIFAVCSEYNEDTLKIEEHIVLGANYTHLFIYDNEQERISTLRIEDIGNFLFLTREEAEAKLKELNNER